MLFNSWAFIVFLPCVFAAYWMVNRWTAAPAGLRLQNALLLLASYAFYGWWDVRFLALIALSTGVDYFIGRKIHACNNEDLPAGAPAEARSRRAKRWLVASVVANLGMLVYFKYANFFLESWVNTWASVGVSMETRSLQVILPVGISFYTFQTLSYAADIYRRQLRPTQDLLAFAAFVSFFPQLVAGPIERASALLPQVLKRRRFDFNEAASGMRLLLWGLFKKVAIADTAGLFVDEVFGPSGTTTGGAFILAALLFSVQIYGDFSGYSDMAIGIGRLFGIRLSTNFRSPFLSRSMREFWSRWHISLSQWFTTYLYLPLGGSRAGGWKTRRNVLLVFAVSGLWHGASWNFVLWGVVNGLLVLSQWRAKPPSATGRWWPSSRELWQMGTTFVVFSATMTLFRSEDLGHLSALISSIFEAKSGAQSTLQQVQSLGLGKWEIAGFLVALMAAAAFEWCMSVEAFRRLYLANAWLRRSSYLVAAGFLFLLSRPENPAAFIYFQF